jgi:CheY-like chemotaxis protein
MNHLVSSAPPRIKRVVIAEDEYLLATDIRMRVQSLGVRVEEVVANGRLAIEQARQKKPDMMLMDIAMPELDGLHAAETIYQELGIPTVIITSAAKPISRSIGPESGVYGYILKPITDSELRDCMGHAWLRFCAAKGADGGVISGLSSLDVFGEVPG